MKNLTGKIKGKSGKTARKNNIEILKEKKWK